MPLNPKDSFDAARDVAVHSVEKASDIVDNAAVEKVRHIVTGDAVDTDAEA